jgi:hypothetical protein
MKAWIGRARDPAAFDIDHVNHWRSAAAWIQACSP